jgi:hypothetical protein
MIKCIITGCFNWTGKVVGVLYITFKEIDVNVDIPILLNRDSAKYARFQASSWQMIVYVENEDLD